MNSVPAILALVAAVAVYVVSRSYRTYQKMKDLPGPPYHPIWGHLKVAGECMDSFPPSAHPHAYFVWLRKKYNLSKHFFFVDFSPAGAPELIILDPELASRHAIVTNSLPKSSLVVGFLDQLIGKNNMVGLEGSAWKNIRTCFQPGFNSGHLMTLVPYIVDMCEIFCETLRQKANTGEVFEMEEVATRLTVDIIGKVVLDIDLNSQRAKNPIVDAFRYRVSQMPVIIGVKGFILQYIDFPRFLRLWWNGRKLDRLIGAELDKRYASRTSTPGTTEKISAKPRSRSIVDLALDTYQKEFQNSSQVRANTMDKTFRQTALVQIKTFIFAGHDTTSSTIAYAFYLLHLHPDKHARVVAELDSVLGSDRSRAPSMIKKDPYIINKLDYCTAVVKEVLRIYPPASTIRYCPRGSTDTITDPDTGISYPMAGWHVWPPATAIHRNETYFPRPEAFIPERFLPDENPFPEAKQHKDAWRPFERGPRNCIGQELALIETKVIMALTLREFDFEHLPRKLATREEEERDAIEGRRCFQILKGGAKPVGGMPGRVFLR